MDECKARGSHNAIPSVGHYVRPWALDSPVQIRKPVSKKITITNGAAWSIEFLSNGGYFDTRKKSLETRSELKIIHLIGLDLKT